MFDGLYKPFMVSLGLFIIVSTTSHIYIYILILHTICILYVLYNHPEVNTTWYFQTYCQFGGELFRNLFQDDSIKYHKSSQPLQKVLVL